MCDAHCKSPGCLPAFGAYYVVLCCFVSPLKLSNITLNLQPPVSKPVNICSYRSWPRMCFYRLRNRFYLLLSFKSQA